MILTIDEAILNIDEEIERLKDDIENAEIAGITVNYTGFDSHIDSKRQLVDWLKELKELREMKLCKDTVSRKAAIDAMCSACGNDCDKSEFVYDAPRWEQVILCPEHYALTVLPSVQPESCGDAVNRNAIIRALNTMDRYVSDELTLCNTDRKFPKNEVFIVDDVYEEIVERLPSVQPDPCGGE